jgi:hypothetical protein
MYSPFTPNLSPKIEEAEEDKDPYNVYYSPNAINAMGGVCGTNGRNDIFFPSNFWPKILYGIEYLRDHTLDCRIILSRV